MPVNAVKDVSTGVVDVTSRASISAGTVQSIAGGNGLTPGPITTSGTIALVALTSGWNAGNFPINSANSEDDINASAYGVVADGSLTVSGTGTDQTTNFVAALTAAITAGKKLRINAGVYKFTQQVTIPDVFGVTTNVHVNIEGAGSPSCLLSTAAAGVQAGGTILQFWTGAGVHGISYSPSNSLPLFTMTNLEIRGPDTDNGTILTSATSGDGLRLIGGPGQATIRLNLTAVDVNHFGGGRGYYFSGCENGSVRNISAQWCAKGMSFQNSSNANQLYDIEVTRTTTRGIEILGGVDGLAEDEINIHGGLLQSNQGTGIYVNGATNCNFEDVHFESNALASGYAFHSLGTVAAGTQNGYIRLSGCWFAAATDVLFIDATGGGTNAFGMMESCRFNVTGPTVNSVNCIGMIFLNSGAGTLTDSGTATRLIGKNTSPYSDSVNAPVLFGSATTAAATGISVDIKGSWAARNGGNVTFVNGLNSDVALPAVGTNFVIIGPTGAFQLGGIKGESGTAAHADGRIITLTSSVAQSWTINHNDAGSTAGNKIYCPTGANLLINANSSWCSVTMQYAGPSGAWFIVGRSN